MLPTPSILKIKNEVIVTEMIRPFLLFPDISEKTNRKNKKIIKNKTEIIKLLLGGKKKTIDIIEKNKIIITRSVGKKFFLFNINCLLCSFCMYNYYI